MLDTIEIKIRSGNGGNGSISGRREKFVPEGGPDGGDGGNGGSITVYADPNENTLQGYRYKKYFSAENGGNGSGKLRHGKDGEGILLKVPVGTQVWSLEGKREQLIYDLNTPKAAVVLAKGGRGGNGNAKFKSSINRFPLLAEGGEQGKRLIVRFELKLISDVGIIGSPNAGKSSLLAAVTAAKPKIADYPFTTTEPILGVVVHQDVDFVMADIPGLLEGAHEGVGLGREFLRHIERTRLLLHVVDGSLENPLEEYKKVRKEIGLYSEAMLGKPEVVVINKIDVVNNATGLQEEIAKVRGEGVKVMWISAATREGLSSLMNEVVGKLNELRDSFPEGVIPKTNAVTTLVPESAPPSIKETDGEYVVRDARSERISKMVDPSNWDAKVQFYEHLRRSGVIAALEKTGISGGDIYRIGNLKLEWA
tara:strand:- start:1787 stop:3055 length:1269 start_codon:yes stop_codon:yes gene_type:complete